ncbi:hypothetical protein ERO13_D05G070000v2 [Gossypium hirsutum]|uniref:Pentacotripeptide-repeat region of PRORP domain-containing protein n=1 Tax=Gossypium mustelinum TaxID=34275 RepID=A0A5D2URW1_GOSMU|nr:hypothetical protein ERO13_D05G070000v2 [Gossypium hirsutum]TYI80221.1 hypothetical protein E1A91_D05G073200v1 [Gossypium mustelinum]
MKNTKFFRQTFSLDYIALLLQKCIKAKALKPGKQLHARLLLTGTDMEVLSLSSKLVGMYAGCGDLKSSGSMFGKIKTPNVFALNWMVLASAFNGYFKEAIGYFSLMSESINLCNKFTFSVVLKACVGLMNLNKGKEVHAVVNKLCLETDVNVGNGLIDMYCKCGNVSYARKMFDRMAERDVASWTSMISGYCNVGKNEEALGLFERMKLEDLQPNEFTWNVMITAFARRGDIRAALALFGRMTKEGLLPDLVTWNTIISGFAQGHCPFEAFNLFRHMLVSGIKPNHVTVTGFLPACGLTGSIEKASWNALIGCYGKHGMVESAITMFERMQEEGVQVNDATLTCVLSACSHGGYVEEGLRIFGSMKQSYGIEGAKEHYACVVDMLCRSGKMVEAYELLKEMPFGVTNSIVGAFFNGCKVHGRKDLAKLMGEEILKMELRRPGGLVTLSNIYAADEEWGAVENVRKVMKEKRIHKKPGFSCEPLQFGGFLGE